MTVRLVGAELFHAERRTDGQTDRHDEANSHSSQFCERPYKRVLPWITRSNKWDGSRTRGWIQFQTDCLFNK